jgi:hypothetical protein
MLLSSIKKMGYKCLMVVANLCRWGVSQLNGSGYNPRSGQRRHIHSFEGAYSISQNCQQKTKQWPNDESSRLNPRN